MIAIAIVILIIIVIVAVRIIAIIILIIIVLVAVAIQGPAIVTIEDAIEKFLMRYNLAVLQFYYLSTQLYMSIH